MLYTHKYVDKLPNGTVIENIHAIISIKNIIVKKNIIYIFKYYSIKIDK